MFLQLLLLQLFLRSVRRPTPFPLLLAVIPTAPSYRLFRLPRRTIVPLTMKTALIRSSRAMRWKETDQWREEQSTILRSALHLGCPPAATPAVVVTVAAVQTLNDRPPEQYCTKQSSIYYNVLSIYKTFLLKCCLLCESFFLLNVFVSVPSYIGCLHLDLIQILWFNCSWIV